MRKIAFILLIAAMAAGCTKNSIDRPEDRSICFAPVAEKATKAIIQGATYPTTEAFTVSAYHEGTSAYFENLSASYNSTLTLWETATAEYWPLAGSLTFNAYSPSSASDVTITSDGVTATGYTVQTATQMTTDLCYGSYTVADCASHPESVPLQFSHALTQVVFRVKAASYYENTSLSMTSLSMSGICSVGDFTGSAWENQNTEFNYDLHGISTVLTYDGTTPVTTDVCSYLFVPQTLGPNAAINVGYSVDFGGGRTLNNPPVTVSITGGTITEWVPGKKYIYTLNIGLDNVITISASTVGWSDQGYNIIVEES